MNVVENLIEFRMTQDIKVLNVTDCFDKENLNVIVIEILSWLQLQRKREIWIEQGRKASLKPMPIFPECPWCCELKEYMQQDNVLSNYFIIANNTLDFKPDISEEVAHNLRVYAYENYEPEKMS